MNLRVERLGDVRTRLGEGPYWDPQDQVLYFVDMRGGAVWRFDPNGGQFTSWPTPREPSGLSRTRDGGFIVALSDGFYDFNPATGAFTFLVGLADLSPGATLNDVKVDRQGRFVVGGKSNGNGPLNEWPPTAGVFSLADGSASTVVDSGYKISNGPCWSPDGAAFYLTESVDRKIYVYDYDRETGGVVGDRRLFVDVDQIRDIPGAALPDGATVDSEGRIWSTFNGSGHIVCFSPDGSVINLFATPVLWVTSVQFGGSELDQMYVTSLDPTVFGDPPDEASGYLYLVEGHGAKGIPEVPVASKAR